MQKNTVFLFELDLDVDRHRWYDLPVRLDRIILINGVTFCVVRRADSYVAILMHSIQERMNVHTFFDPEQGAWIRLPLAWEFHSDFVKPLIADIQVCASQK